MKDKLGLVRSISSRLAMMFVAIAPLSICVDQAIAQSGVASPSPFGAFLDGVMPTLEPGVGAPSVDGELWIQADYYPELNFEEPIRIIEVPDEDRLLIISKLGYGVTVSHEQGATDVTPFFNIRPIMQGRQGVGEGGISDLVFHPEYGQPGSPNSNYVYISYRSSPTTSGTFQNQARIDGYNRVSRFEVINGQVDISTELDLIIQYDRQQFHIAGDMFFGPDGFLYISVGDEGNGFPREISTQRIDGGLFSGLLRIDVDMDPTRSHPIRRQPVVTGENPLNNGPAWVPSSTQNYYIPNDNPFVDPSGNTLEEFYSIGLRHPWTVYQDPVNGTIWTADVGENQYEEINILNAGDNHQWGFMEGPVAGLIDRPNTIIGNEVEPVFAYSHVPPSLPGQDLADNGAVIGGGVYRGGQFPELFGKYIFWDFISGRLWTLTQTPNGFEEEQIATLTSGFSGGINGALMDSRGDILLAQTNGPNANGGRIQMLVRAGSVVPTPEPPATLSATGAFTNLANLSVHPGCIPYDLNVPFWSDGALKSRWLCVPNDGSHNTPEEQIGFSEEGIWTFPVGSVIIKHFELLTDQNDPSSAVRLETRFIVHGEGGHYGVTYRWDDAGVDAHLLTSRSEPETATYTVQTDSGSFEQTWLFPSRSQCSECHNASLGNILGTNTRQLNREITYSGSGVEANQIETMNSLGMLSPSIPAMELDNLLSNVLTASPTLDTNLSLAARARSYLDSNCAYCHNPSGGPRAFFDARLTTPLADQGLIFGELETDFGFENEAPIVPGDVLSSIIYHRANSVEPGITMPPIAKSIVDTDGLAVLAEWIESLDSFELGNDTSQDANSIDAHHPSLYVNESDFYVQDNELGEVFIEDFNFYARELGNPLTPIVFRVNADNVFTVVAIGTSREQSEYNLGENSFAFSDDGPVALQLAAGERIVTGFMDAFPDGTGWGAGSVIPFDGGPGTDEIFSLLPNPLINVSSGFVAGRVTPSVSIGQTIVDTTLPHNQPLRSRDLNRNYRYSVTFSPLMSDEEEGEPDAPEFVNGSFELPLVNTFEIYSNTNAIPGWQIVGGSVEIDRTPWDPYEGLQSMDLNGAAAGAIEQTVSGFNVGSFYEFALEYALHFQATSTLSAEILINGEVVETLTGGPGMLVPNYQTARVGFIATDTEMTFGVASVSAGSLGVVVDNLRLIETAPSLPVISNPSFEFPAINNFAIFSGSTSLPGWNVISGDVELDRTPWPASDQDQSLTLNGTTQGAMEQEISGFIPGQNYVLSFDYGRHRGGGSILQRADVLINGEIVQSVVAGANMVPPNYQTAAVRFQAPEDGVVTIGFSSDSVGGLGVALDNLSLSLGATVPEVVNGSFESPVVNSFEQFNTADAITGWTVISGSVEIDRTPWPAFEGQQSMDLSGSVPGSLEQTLIGFIPGAQYSLNFAYGIHRGANTSLSADVFVNGEVIETIVANTSMVPPNYQQASIEFVAPADGIVTIGFASRSSNGLGVVIDNVHVE